METLVISNIDDELAAQLRVSAASHGCSVAEEANSILRRAFLSTRVRRSGFGRRIHQHFSALGGVQLDLPARNEKPRVVDLSE